MLFIFRRGQDSFEKSVTTKASPGVLRSFRSTLALLAGGNVIAAALKLAAGLLTGRLIEPAALGLFNSIGLVLGWSHFLQMGVLNGLNRELPYFFGKGEPEVARELGSAAQYWAIIAGTLLAVGCLLIAAWQLVIGHGQYAAAWLTNAIGGWSMFYVQYYLQTTYRTHHDFGRLAFINIVQSAMNLALVVLVWLFAFYGLCTRAVIVTVSHAVLMWLWRPLRVVPRWNWERLRHLLRIGTPIFFAGQLYSWWVVLDATLVFYYLGAEGLGLYSVAVLGANTLQILPESVNQILYPKLMEQCSKSVPYRFLIAESARKSAFLTAVMLPILAIIWWLIGPLIQYMLPNYVAAISAARWSLLLSAAGCLTPFNLIFNVLKRQDIYIIAILSGIASYYVVLRGLIHQDLYLSAFPQAMLLGRLLMSGLCILWIYLKAK